MNQYSECSVKSFGTKIHSSLPWKLFRVYFGFFKMLGCTLQTCVDLSSILGSLANVGLLVLGILGITKLWPDYKRQKRIENNSIAAMNALSQLEDCEGSLDLLFQTVKNRSEVAYHRSEQNKVLLNLRSLKNRLLLLRTDKTIKEQLFWIQKLIEMFGRDTSDTAILVQLSFKILGEVDANYSGNKKLDLSKLEKIREALVTIYEIEED